MNKIFTNLIGILIYSRTVGFIAAGLFFINTEVLAQATSLTIIDGRNGVSTPDSYYRAVIANFRSASLFGLPTVGSGFVTTLGLRPWADNTGGKSHELAFSDDSKVFFRSGSSPAWESWRELLIKDHNNKVIIGSNTAAGELELTGKIFLPGLLGYNVLRPLLTPSRITGEISGSNYANFTADDGFLRLSAGGGTNVIAKTFIDMSGYSTTADMDRNIIFGTSGVERVRIKQNGYVGIGTANPQEALSVNGNIRSKQVVVETTNWPDYVFDQDYKMISLPELKYYISVNKRLPGIPSAAEITTRGQNLGEINRLLTQKIEELTLYLLEQHESNKKQQQQIDWLTKTLVELKKN